MQNTLGPKHLMEILKAKGLPHAWKTLLNYEKTGIIKRPNRSIDYSETHKWRVYTQAEIDTIVKNIQNFKNNGKK